MTGFRNSAVAALLAVGLLFSGPAQAFPDAGYAAAMSATPEGAMLQALSDLAAANPGDAVEIALRAAAEVDPSLIDDVAAWVALGTGDPAIAQEIATAVGIQYPEIAAEILLQVLVAVPGAFNLQVALLEIEQITGVQSLPAAGGGLAFGPQVLGKQQGLTQQNQTSNQEPFYRELQETGNDVTQTIPVVDECRGEECQF